ncbi:hypothetical protein F5Y03DRAFT_56509 [Xylaria venustula]|nr:hypothetical protein F5Y03DRAFT_56509 [Xylaria venustula]
MEWSVTHTCILPLLSLLCGPIPVGSVIVTRISRWLIKPWTTSEFLSLPAPFRYLKADLIIQGIARYSRNSVTSSIFERPTSHPSLNMILRPIYFQLHVCLLSGLGRARHDRHGAAPLKVFLFDCSLMRTGYEILTLPVGAQYIYYLPTWTCPENGIHGTLHFISATHLGRIYVCTLSLCLCNPH